MEYLKREFKQWDKITPVYSERLDKYFFTSDELSDYFYENEISDDDPESDLQLVLCQPNYLTQINFDD
jgi:hypothetical protein